MTKTEAKAFIKLHKSQVRYRNGKISEQPENVSKRALIDSNAAYHSVLKGKLSVS